MEQPTQVQHPGRATLRTVVAAMLALLPALPEMANQLGVATIPWVISILAVAAGITRLLATPLIADWIADHMAWLAPHPRLVVEPVPPPIVVAASPEADVNDG